MVQQSNSAATNCSWKVEACMSAIDVCGSTRQRTAAPFSTRVAFDLLSRVAQNLSSIAKTPHSSPTIGVCGAYHSTQQMLVYRIVDMANSDFANFVHGLSALSTVNIAYLCSQLTDQVFSDSSESFFTSFISRPRLARLTAYFSLGASAPSCDLPGTGLAILHLRNYPIPASRHGRGM
jgi:hypothetical protein